MTHGGSYPAGGYGADDDDFSGAAEHATRGAGESADPSLFSTLLGALTQKKQSLASQEVDEDGTFGGDPIRERKKNGKKKKKKTCLSTDFIDGSLLLF